MSGRHLSGRTRRCVYSREQATSKTIGVSPETLAKLISLQHGKEALEDTIRRLLKLPARKPIT